MNDDVQSGMPTKYTDVMIDIETLGTNPDCVILSIGAVLFNRDSGVGPVWATTLNIFDQLMLGRRVEYDTVAWWQKQGAACDTMRDALAFSVSDLYSTLQSLSRFIRNECFEDFSVWANSPKFDLSILEHAYSSQGMNAPWTHRQQRDYRTLVDIAGSFGYVAAKNDGMHSAEEDAKHQADQVRYCFLAMRRFLE